MFMRTRYFKPCPLLPIASQKTTCNLWEVISYSHKVNKNTIKAGGSIAICKMLTGVGDGVDTP